MRRVLVPVVLLILVLPLLALASAEQVPLQADLQHGIVVWDRSIVLYKRAGGPQNMCFDIILGSDDLRVIEGWNVDTIYVVVHVFGVDYYATRPPQMAVVVKASQGSLGDVIYSSRFVDVPRASVYEFPIPMDRVLQASEITGIATITICISDWDVSNTAPDNYYSVSIYKVELAPPRGVIHEQQNQPQQHTVTNATRSAPVQPPSQQRLDAIIDRLDALDRAQHTAIIVVGVIAVAAFAVALASIMRGRR